MAMPYCDYDLPNPVARADTRLRTRVVDHVRRRRMGAW
jgi:hypothetical protein